MNTPRQILDNTIKPTLEKIGLYSDAAAELLWGTAAQESHFKYRRQLVNGPAVGLWQMEPFTYRDCWNNYLIYHKDLSNKVQALILPTYPPGVAQLEFNDPLAVAMARIKYLRAPEPLPPVGDLLEQAKYYKHWYNTPLGAATVDEYIENWHKYCENAE